MPAYFTISGEILVKIGKAVGRQSYCVQIIVPFVIRLSPTSWEGRQSSDISPVDDKLCKEKVFIGQPRPSTQSFTGIFPS